MQPARYSSQYNGRSETRPPACGLTDIVTALDKEDQEKGKRNEKGVLIAIEEMRPALLFQVVECAVPWCVQHRARVLAECWLRVLWPELCAGHPSNEVGC